MTAATARRPIAASAAAASYGPRMLRALVAAPLTLALAFTLPLAACSSKKQRDTIPSSMLGPTEPGAAQPGPAEATPAEATPTATADAAPTEATPAAPLSASEQALLGEMQAIMKEVSTQFERLVSALESASGDCKKAATALSASASASLAIEQKMTAFKQKLGQGPKPSAELMAQLREATLTAFPTDTRARAETTFDTLDKTCAGDADFQRAKQASAPPSN